MIRRALLMDDHSFQHGSLLNNKFIVEQTIQPFEQFRNLNLCQESKGSQIDPHHRKVMGRQKPCRMEHGSVASQNNDTLCEIRHTVDVFLNVSCKVTHPVACAAGFFNILLDMLRYAQPRIFLFVRQY